MNIKELSNVIREAGVVGAGGAGFPTYVKLDERANTIIMNCAECEPLLKLHMKQQEEWFVRVDSQSRKVSLYLM